jgi:hypothetical protein
MQNTPEGVSRSKMGFGRSTLHRAGECPELDTREVAQKRYGKADEIQHTGGTALGKRACGILTKVNWLRGQFRAEGYRIDVHAREDHLLNNYDDEDEKTTYTGDRPPWFAVAIIENFMD